LEDNNGYKNNKTLQRVLVLKAVEDYKNRLFTQSSRAFEKAIKVKEDKMLEAYSLYWLGRSLYERNQFDEALNAFKKFQKHPEKNQIEASSRLPYDMAYIYFKLGEYDYSLTFFEEFNSVNSSFDSSYQYDTFLRMGDCQFALKQYWPAMEFII
jgi:tetratricopeptide (TPR) repeat protein